MPTALAWAAVGLGLTMAALTQQGEAADAEDEREATERLEKQAEAAATGDDRPGRE